MMAELVETMNRQNEQQLQQVVQYFEQQRIEDLKLVDQTLDRLQQNTSYRLNQTNRYLTEVLQTVSSNNQN